MLITLFFLFEHIERVEYFKTKVFFDEKYDSCSKMLVVSQKLDLLGDTRVISINHFYHQSVNVNSPIHSTVLSALRRSGKRTEVE